EGVVGERDVRRGAAVLVVDAGSLVGIVVPKCGGQAHRVGYHRQVACGIVAVALGDRVSGRERLGGGNDPIQAIVVVAGCLRERVGLSDQVADQVVPVIAVRSIGARRAGALTGEVVCVCSGVAVGVPDGGQVAFGVVAVGGSIAQRIGH